MDLKETYNKIAVDWHKDHQSDSWWVEATDKFINFLPTSAKVLDVGCGAGVKSKYLINHGLRIVGIDFSESMIGIAKKEVPNAEFLVMDFLDVSNLKETFDGIFAQASLLHVPKQKTPQVIRGLNSKLKIGGYFYIAVKEPRDGNPEEEVKKKNDYGYEYEIFFSYYTIDEIKKYCADLNMEVVYSSISLSGRAKWVQVIAKKT